MCGGNKGQSSTTQTSTYQPTQQASNAITGALTQAQQAAQTPFSAPVAPVAGFSQDQQGAFQQFRDLQGSAQPYFNQAQADFSPQGTQAFYNPYADAVTANMKDIFGAQQAQTTGQLTQAAGGVGADRIAVGQADLAKQQDLAAGQTYASLWNSASQQAQAAGQGQMNLGNNVMNSQLTGANALLGSGGLQQQLSQAQMNAPYQQQLAQLAYPFQTAQFLAGVTGSLVPGLGGTTSGQGTSTPAQPSIWSQLLGAGTAAAGIYGGLGGGTSSPSYGGGNMFSGDAYGGSSSNPLPGLSASDYGAGFESGGRINPYASGGQVKEEQQPQQGDIPVSSAPINIASHSIVPDVQLQPIRPNIPQVNLTPPQSSGGSGSSGPSLGDVAKIAMMFANRGGAVCSPFSYDGGGTVPDFDDRYGAAFPNRREEPAPTVDEPVRMPSADATDAWRAGVDTDRGNGMTASGTGAPIVLPRAITGAPAEDDGTTALGFAPQGGRSAPAAAPARANPYAGAAADVAGIPVPERDTGFAGSPWSALTAAGLGMMAGTSPFAGVNIGAGGQAGLKTLQEQRAAAQKDETTDMAARRLAIEAQHHTDEMKRADRPYNELTKYQQMQMDAEQWQPAGNVQTKDGLHPLFYDKKTLELRDGITGKPPEKTDSVISKGGSKNSPEEIGHVVDGIIDGSSPPTLTGLYGDSVHVRAGLHAKNFDLAKAQVDWDRAKKATAAVNSSRMTQYVALNKSVDRTIDEVKDLSEQLQLGGVPFMNRLELAKYAQTQGNSDKGQLATRYITAVNTLKEEFANLANGGYAPTEAAWKLANEQVNGNFGVKQLGASLQEIQRLIRYRIQSVPNLDTLGPGGANRYTGQGATAAPATGAPAGGHGGKPDVATRFNELIGGGKTEEETYAILKEEGYK